MGPLSIIIHSKNVSICPGIPEPSLRFYNLLFFNFLKSII
jgi:hypothetical protein